VSSASRRCWTGSFSSPIAVLQPLIDPTFSEASYGFRPGRSAHDAVRRAQAYVQKVAALLWISTWRSFRSGQP